MTASSGAQGFRKDRPVRELLLAMLNEDMPDGASTPFRQVVGRLIAQAVAGDWQAMKEIFDRLDGPPELRTEEKGETRLLLVETGIRCRQDPSEPAGI